MGKSLKSKKLFIVESPSKIQTLKKLLDSRNNSFIFLATYGHIMDLPLKDLGVDLSTFEPQLLYLESKRKVLTELKKLVSFVEEVYLATDPDREGEAISYHLFEFLKKLKPSLKFFRLELHEITELGVKEAFKNIRGLDEGLYLSWKARRVCDRLIGYLVSPYLSRAFKKALSSGRVQSPALRLIVEREKEILNFIPEKSYSLLVIAEDAKGNSYEFEIFAKKELLKKKNKEELIEIFEKYLKDREVKLIKIQEKTLKKLPPKPLKTSTLIEIAGKFLGFSAKETMRIAQRLYESGYITYMRTDSTRVSPLAKKEAKAFIEKVFGKEYVGGERRERKKGFIQDAHECIRPTKLSVIETQLGPKEDKLYSLIRTCFLASQMKEALYQENTYEFTSSTLPSSLKLIMKRKKLLFDGFLKIFKEEEEALSEMPPLKEGDFLKVRDYKIKTHETKPPERYTEESLIKKMEALGIGRPSTYATMLDILFTRGYVIKERRYLKPTELGIKVCEFLEAKTPLFMDYKFTARLEEALDEISEFKRDYVEVVKEVYEILKGYLEK